MGVSRRESAKKPPYKPSHFDAQSCMHWEKRPSYRFSWNFLCGGRGSQYNHFCRFLWQVLAGRLEFDVSPLAFVVALITACNTMQAVMRYMSSAVCEHLVIISYVHIVVVSTDVLWWWRWGPEAGASGPASDGVPAAQWWQTGETQGWQWTACWKVSVLSLFLIDSVDDYLYQSMYCYLATCHASK